jgi:hypothetical protein
MVYYTVYKVTNLVNSKHYIGKHQTNNLNDGYMGSGKLIRAAIKKYGIQNFSKEILYIFDNEALMDSMEAALVVLSENSYNLCDGGKGGFSYINKNGMNGLKNISAEDRKRFSKKGGAAMRLRTIERNKSKKGISKATPQLNTAEAIIKRSATLKQNGNQKGEKNSQYGRPKSPETIEKIKASMVGKPAPPNLKGFFWWTNSQQNKRAQECPGPGWIRGKTQKLR